MSTRYVVLGVRMGGPPTEIICPRSHTSSSKAGWNPLKLKASQWEGLTSGLYVFNDCIQGLSRWLGCNVLPVWAQRLDLGIPGTHVKSQARLYMPATSSIGCRDRRIPRAHRLALGSMIDHAWKKPVKTNWGRHLLSTSGVHVLLHTHVHTSQAQIVVL